jgi:uncharacterized protein (TIGR03435 family)
MKKLLLWMVGLVVATGTGLRAQDVAGPWQGTIEAPGRSMRCLLQVAQDGAALKGKFFLIDQPAPALSTSTLSISGGVLQFSIKQIEVVYEGKLSADGKSTTGTWKQGAGTAVPLNLTHVTAEAAWPIPVPPKPMAADADPGYDVATIKPSQPDRPGKAFTLRGRSFVTINTTLSDLITFAYQLHPKQLTGGPAWMDTDKWDLDVLPDVEGTPSIKQSGAILRKLLADRFQLKFHRVDKELAVYALQPGKTGPKLKKSDSDPLSPPGLGFRGLGKLNVRNASMKEFTDLMQSAVLDRPVVDQTKLDGRYDFELNWTPDESQFNGAYKAPATEPADAAPSLFTAVQEQLGLRLESTKAPVSVLAIDHVEKPSAN